MTLEYKIFENGTGVVLTRQPETVYDEIVLSFTDAPVGATAIVVSGEKSMYRALEGSSCAIPVDKLDGVVKVTIATLDGSASTRRWFCEELFAEKMRDGGTLISPNDMNLPQRYVELKMENEEIRQRQSRIEKRLEELDEKLERLLEGYDLT